MAYAKLQYDISDEESPDNIWEGLGTNIDKVISFATRLRDARDVVRQNYDGKVTCVIHMDGDPHSISATIEELHEGTLESSLGEYISLAGLPDFIWKGSDWDICDKVLAEYKKTTKRRVAGGSIGRQVEDIK